jgi:hypothetical protein
MASRCLDVSKERSESMVDVQCRRLEIETTLKLLSKWDHHRYGDRLTVDQTIEVKASPLAQLRSLERGPVVDVSPVVHDVPAQVVEDDSQAALIDSGDCL